MPGACWRCPRPAPPAGQAGQEQGRGQWGSQMEGDRAASPARGAAVDPHRKQKPLWTLAQAGCACDTSHFRNQGAAGSRPTSRNQSLTEWAEVAPHGTELGLQARGPAQRSATHGWRGLVRSQAHVPGAG